MTRRRRNSSPWDRAIEALLLVKLGQSIGYGGPLAEAVRGLVEAVLAVVR